MAIDWKSQARRWQRAFHALEDEMLNGQKIGSRIEPKKKKAPAKAKKRAGKRKAPAKDLFDLL